MTRNQIDYAKLLETQRYNSAQIAAQNRKITEDIALGYAQLGETSRHNLITESLDSAKIEESKRHNLAQEQQASNVLYEETRHNLSSERLNFRQLSEQSRHNQVYEAETARHNVVAEKESIRANKMRETLESRSQSIAVRGQDVNATSVRRGQDLSYDVGMSQVGLGYEQLSETARSHRASESLESASIGQRYEAARLNFSLGMGELDEQRRHSLAVEEETRRTNMAREGETVRSDIAREGETRRHNYQMEMLQTAELDEAVRHNQAKEDIDMRGVNVGGLRETTNTIDHVMKWLNLTE